MKRVLSIFLCFVICCLSFVACGKKEEKTEKSNPHHIDIAQWVKKGGIPETDLKLGGDVEMAKEKLSEVLDEHGEPAIQEFTPTSKDDYTILSDGTVSCAYVTELPEKGIKYLIYLNGGYGFDAGTAPDTISKVMNDQGFKASERKAKTGELFFVLGGNSGTHTVLEYTIEDTTLLFIFQENTLNGVAIYK